MLTPTKSVKNAEALGPMAYWAINGTTHSQITEGNPKPPFWYVEKTRMPNEIIERKDPPCNREPLPRSRSGVNNMAIHAAINTIGTKLIYPDNTIAMPTTVNPIGGIKNDIVMSILHRHRSRRSSERL